MAGCNLSLAADVTPPPGYAAPTAGQTPAPVAAGPLYPLVPPDPAAGQPVFVEKCAPCHGETGLGDGPRAADLPNPVPALGTAETARAAAPAEWYRVVTQGNLERFMPPFASLTDDQRWDVVAYALSLSAPAASVEQGRQVFAQDCAGCHGPEGAGDGPQAASLDPKPTNLAEQERMASRSGQALFDAISQGQGQGMPAFGDKLSEADRWALVDFLRSLTFAESSTQASAGETPAAAETFAAGTTPGAAAAAETAVPSVTEPVSPTVMIGIVAGQVTNASGGELPTGEQVTLHGFDQMQIAITATTTVEPDGKFAFQDIRLDPGLAFLATVNYQGTTYGSEIATIQSGTSQVDLPITVYDTTTDTAGIVADRLHLFFEFAATGNLRVIELYILSNMGSKTVTAAQEGGPVIQYKLPEGAVNLEFQDGALGDRYVQTADGFGDTAPIRPGQESQQVLYAYELPYDKKLNLALPVNLPVNAVVVLAPEQTVKVKSQALTDAGVREAQGASYHMYNGGSLKTGDTLEMTITGAAAGTAATGTNQNLVIGLVAFGVVLIGAGVWLFRRNQAAGAGPDEAEEPLPPAAGESPEAVMDAILALDDLYKAGDLPEEAYLQRRAELKARLKDLMS